MIDIEEMNKVTLKEAIAATDWIDYPHNTPIDQYQHLCLMKIRNAVIAMLDCRDAQTNKVTSGREIPSHKGE